MPINVSSVGYGLRTPPIGQTTPKDSGATESFQQTLQNVVDGLNQLQAEADTSSARLAAGEAVELHEVLLAQEKASMSFQLAMQVRNKVVEAYQEIMRMQV